VEINRKTNNFDLIRLLLAITVAIVHLAYLSSIDFLQVVDKYINPEVAVDCFFVISGFLIFMSYDSSSSLSKYISKRLRRIFPGYITVVLFCAFFLYFVSTKSSLSEYFNIDFLKYLFFNLTTLNFLHPTLPGVFENSQIESVNGALWTIKIELMFYMSVPVIAYIISKYNRLYTIIFIYILAILYSYSMIYLYHHYDSKIFLTLERQLPGQLAFFIAGAAVYYYYSYFYEKRYLFLIFAVIVLLIDNYITDLYIFYPLAIAILVLYFASMFKYLGNFGKYGDFSFGVYIWHFPILQILIAKNMFENEFVGIALFILLTTIAAYLSWHFVEKRFLYKSSHYITSEKK